MPGFNMQWDVERGWDRVWLCSRSCSALELMDDLNRWVVDSQVDG